MIMTVAYILYLAIAIAFTVWRRARRCPATASVFLVECFGHDEVARQEHQPPAGESAFYLMTRLHLPRAAVRQAAARRCRDLMIFLSSKVGLAVLVLGGNALLQHARRRSHSSSSRGRRWLQRSALIAGKPRAHHRPERGTPTTPGAPAAPARRELCSPSLRLAKPPSDVDRSAAAFASGQRGLEVVDQVGLLPREEVALGLAAEVAVGRGLAVDRLVEPEVRADAARGQAAELVDRLDRRPRSGRRRPCRCRGCRHRATAASTRRSRRRAGSCSAGRGRRRRCSWRGSG